MSSDLIISIRKANEEDASPIADCLFLAMEEIVYTFIGERNRKKAADFLQELVKRPANQYSYENCWVALVDNKIVAAANVYDGADLHQLRQPVLHFIQANFQRSIQPEDETEAGELYLDSFGVLPEYQGKGIGAMLLQFLIEEYVHEKRCALGLLVDEENPKAKRLYLKLGFQPVGRKVLLGKMMEHLQVRPLIKERLPDHSSSAEINESEE